MGVDKSCRFKVPKWPTINTGMLCGPCKDGPRYSSYARESWPRMSRNPNNVVRNMKICSAIMGDNMSLKKWPPSWLLSWLCHCQHKGCEKQMKQVSHDRG